MWRLMWPHRRHDYSREDLVVSNRFDDAICVIAPERLQIYYYVLGTDQPLRNIQIEFGADVDTLIRQICADSRSLCVASLKTGAKSPGDFPELNERMVKLFKADAELFIHPAAVLQTNISVDNTQLLLPGTELARYLKDSRELYVVVYELTIVSRSSSNKRNAEGSGERQKKKSRTEIVSTYAKQPPPSVITAKPSEMMTTTQTTSRAEELYNGRPIEHTGPPIFIYHPTFAKFVHRMREHDIENTSSPSHLARVSRFATKVCERYTSKADRCVSYSRSAPFTQPEIRANVFTEVTVRVNGEEFRPDGSLSTLLPLNKTEEINVYVLFTEVSNELGDTHTSTNSDPIIRAQIDHRNLYSAPEYESIRKISCCPSFLLILTDQICMIYGAIFADHPIYQLLTQPIAIGPDYTTRAQGQDYWTAGVQRLAHVFRVLEECVDDLRCYYRGLCSDDGLPAAFPHHFCPPHFVKFPPGKEDHRLEYIERLAPENPQKAIFKARLIKNSEEITSTVVVKFSSTYNPDAHHLLANRGLAPKLWFCERVESVGNMFVIVMDYIEPFDVNTDMNIRSYPNAVKSLRTAVKLLHDKNLVFGDLREPNVLIGADANEDASVMLIDFDWCAQAGVGRYVFNLNTDARWAPGVADASIMWIEHDVWMFKQLTGEEL